MEPTLELVERLFASGEFVGVLESVGFPNADTTNLEPRVRVIVAQVLAQTGHDELATKLALLDARSTSALLRLQAELVLGATAKRRGEWAVSFCHLQSAIKLAEQSKHVRHLAWSSLSLFRLLIDGHAASDMPSRIADVRRVVTQAGDAHVSAYLHGCVAALEGQRGRLDEAQRHCDIADALLVGAPNAWLRGTTALHRACISCLRADLITAYEQFRQARLFAKQTGQSIAITFAEANLGHIERLRGKWSAARQWLEGVLVSPTAALLARFSAGDALAGLFLAIDQIVECERVVRELDDYVKVDPALRLAYNVRWLGVTKARLLLRRNETQQALTVIADTKRTATEVGDQPLLAMLHLTAAQAFAAAGRPRQAALELIAAENVGATAFREIHAQHYYASALTLRDGDEELEHQLRARAFRLWTYQGIVSVPLEMSAERTEPPASSSTPPRTVESLADAVAATFDLAFSPSLLGTELANIVKALDCSAAPQVVSRTSDKMPASEETVTVSLGREGHKAYTLTCPVPADPRKAILLGDVLRIGRAAVELERYRQEERNRAALWPADPIETEAGALFIAEEMQTLLSTARRLATANIPVLITGETGTGKEVLARLIHAYSNRAKATFLPFNCSATPKDMLDSQLFGHRRGSFTGAVDNFPGVIRTATGGTLFLDEIGEMTLDVQPKLLRFLESGEVHPIGEAHPVKADVRVIAATNADLDALVSDGRFRDDLFYRLNIVRLHVPPLRERRVEIPALANHYLQKYAKENGKGDLRLAEETMEYLLLYRWPGNVRRLANEMRRMAALAESGAVLMPEHLSAEVFASRRTIPASERTLEPTELVVRLDQPMAAAVQHVERAMIMYAMKKCGGGMEETAALLGLSRKGLYLKRQRYAIETPGETAAVA